MFSYATTGSQGNERSCLQSTTTGMHFHLTESESWPNFKDTNYKPCLSAFYTLRFNVTSPQKFENV